MAQPYDTTINRVLPTRAAPGLPDKDARERALLAFRAFLSCLVFNRTNEPGLPPIQVQLPKSSIHIYQPDDVKDAVMPGFGIVPGQGVHEATALGPPEILECTYGLYGEGTALLKQSDYIETFALEAWGSKHAERRALVAGVKSAMRMSDSSYALRLKLPKYYDRVATFSLDESTYLEQDENVRNRRRAHLYIKLQVAEVQLVNVNMLSQASFQLEVVDGNLPGSLHCFQPAVQVD